jgi:glycosyltransferase involved in cell wall biosynthesis
MDQDFNGGPGLILAKATLRMLLFDATHTSHTHAQTGIQRVCRSLFGELIKVRPTTGICYDPYLKSWRELTGGEVGFMQPGRKATDSRSSKWPLHQQLAGHGRRLLGHKPKLPTASGLIVPELFSSKVAARLPEILSQVRGPRVAIFYDAIPLKFPELTPAGTVARMPSYLRELLQFDGVAAISADSALSLREYWTWLGASDTPPVHAIPLGVDPLNSPAVEKPGETNSSIPRILSVGTIEGRKNHLSLILAAEALWKEGLQFELQLLGLARPDTAREALEKIAALQRAGHPLRYNGSVTDAELQTAYQNCSFTVYPSLIEGFGLPVLESLQHGRPCICSGQGALAESAKGGGCLALPSVDSLSLQNAIRSLVRNSAALSTLANAARQRKFQSWAGYGRAFTAWMESLPLRT